MSITIDNKLNSVIIDKNSINGQLNEIESVIGFKLDDFYSEVKNSVNTNINDSIIKFKQELLKILKNKSYKNVSENDIEQACDSLTIRINEYFNINLNKFELYTLRNIFILPSEDNDHKEDTNETIKNTDVTNNPLEKLDDEISILKQKYIDLTTKRLKLSSECKDTDKLLKDMRSALFHLRVNAQVLTSNGQSLDNNLQFIQDNRQELIELTNRSNELIRESKLQVHNNIGESNKSVDITSTKSTNTNRNNSKIKNYSEIVTRNIDDIVRVNNEITKKKK